MNATFCCVLPYGKKMAGRISKLPPDRSHQSDRDRVAVSKMSIIICFGLLPPRVNRRDAKPRFQSNATVMAPFSDQGMSPTLPPILHSYGVAFGQRSGHNCFHSERLHRPYILHGPKDGDTASLDEETPSTSNILRTSLRVMGDWMIGLSLNSWEILQQTSSVG